MSDADTILEFIRDEADLDEGEVTAETSLFRDQLLDSMNLTAVIAFLEGGGREAIITDPAHLGEALAGRTGTHVVP